MKITIDIPGPAQREREEHPLAYAHTNGADTSVPHDTLTEYIDELEKRLTEAYKLVDDSMRELDCLTCPSSYYEDYKRLTEAYKHCPRCSARKKLEKLKILTDLTRKDYEIQ